ncbi:MAG: tetratricopeptide repeat protein [FCB group bacterium]|nr:tetratricopeptide repeat protein [FCB group bacterium]
MISALLVTALISALGPYNDTFDRATEAFQSGDYASAARQYEQLVDEGVVSAPVFHNLGNTYFRLGRLGAAIANFERALQVDPGFEKAALNLRQCVRQTKRHLVRPEETSWRHRVFAWQNALPLGATRALSVFFWFAAWILLGIRVVAPLRYLRLAAVAAAVLAVALSLSAWARTHPTPLAVADRAEVPVHAGMGEDTAVRFTLREGDRVRVVEREFGRARVRAANGDAGWVDATALVFVGPPYEKAPEASAQPSTSETTRDAV